MATPLRKDFDRRQALVELDALAAVMLGITAEELCSIYRTQFGVLRKYERANRYDANGRKVPADILKEYAKHGRQGRPRPLRPPLRRPRPRGRHDPRPRLLPTYGRSGIAVVIRGVGIARGPAANAGGSDPQELDGGAMSSGVSQSYWCIAPSSTLLGSYDGLESWTLHAGTLLEPWTQVVVSLHERLHHELQHTTPWGLVTRFAADLARLGVAERQLTRLFRFTRAEARTLHETYATSLSVGDDVDAMRLIEGNPTYRAYYEGGTRLLRGLDWEDGRFLLDAQLRACMSPAALAGVWPGGFSTIRIADLNSPLVRPDARLAAVLPLDVPAVRPDGLGPRSTPDELGGYFDEVAGLLAERGVPTLRTQQVRELVDALFDDVAHLSPELRRRLELDTTRTPVDDDLDEHSRERILLHDAGPLPLEVVPMSEIGSRAGDFVRDHDRLGLHVALVWVRADLLSRQFRRPNDLTGRPGFVVAVQATGYDEAGTPVARLGVFETESPADVVRAFSMPLVCLTTSASLVDAPETARADGIATMYAVVDLPIAAQLRHTFAQGARITWTRLSLEGGRRLHVFAYSVSALPGIVWLLFTGEAGRHYVTRWFRSLDAGRAVHDPSVFTDREVEIDAAIQHVVSGWWIIDQQGGRTYDRDGHD